MQIFSFRILRCWSHMYTGPEPGPWFNIKMSSYQYKKSHCGDKTILRPSYLHNGISYTGKMTSLYWIRPLFSMWLQMSWHLATADGTPSIRQAGQNMALSYFVWLSMIPSAFWWPVIMIQNEPRNPAGFRELGEWILMDWFLWAVMFSEASYHSMGLISM